MTRLSLLLAVLLAAPLARAQDASGGDTASIDAVMSAMYDVLSGPSDQPRDWDRFRSLFAEGGRMVPMQPGPDGTWSPDVRSLDDYIERFDQILAEHPAFQDKGFYESEAARRVEEYGTIAVVWSTYEGRFSESDVRPFMRGVNTLDLVRVGDEWKVLQVLWQQETPQMPLPDEYLTTPEDD